MAVAVPKLDMGQIKPHCIILIVGKRRTGKSVLLRDLLYHLRRRLSYGVAFTPTEQSAEMFSEFMPRSCIYNEFRPEVVEAMLKFQRRYKPDDKRSLFCVLDDCLSDKKVLTGAAINDLFMNGRHQRITLLLVAQDVMSLGPQLRGNVDYCFCFKDTVITNRRKLFDHFFGVCQKYDTFSKLMNQTTNDRRTIVLDTTGDSHDLDQCVFWYRAQMDLPPFFVGRRSFYRMSLQYERPPGSRAHRPLGPTQKASEIEVHLIGDENEDQQREREERSAREARLAMRLARPPAAPRHVDRPSERRPSERRPSDRRSTRVSPLSDFFLTPPTPSKK
jgi:hypothetical protein